MILQHLKLDGLITPDEEKKWTWNQLWKDIEKEIRRGNYFFDYKIGLEKRMVNIFRKVGEEKKEEKRYAQLLREMEEEKKKRYAQLRREEGQKIAEISKKFDLIICAVLIAAMVGGVLIAAMVSSFIMFDLGFGPEAILASIFVFVPILSAGIYLGTQLERRKMDQIRRVEKEYEKKLRES